MTNNDILKRIRYMFDFKDYKMAKIFQLGGRKLEDSTLEEWMRTDDDEDEIVPLRDQELAIFLNGLIILKRGARDPQPPKPEERLSNNLVLKKLKIALSITSDQIVEMYAAIGKNIGVHELNAALRNPKQRQYRDFQDQYLRQFMNALQHFYRPKKD